MIPYSLPELEFIAKNTTIVGEGYGRELMLWAVERIKELELENESLRNDIYENRENQD